MGPEALLGVAFGGVFLVVATLIAAFVAGYTISSNKSQVLVAWKDETIERLRAEVKGARERARAVAESRRRNSPDELDDVFGAVDLFDELLEHFPTERALPPALEAPRDPRRVG